jgi:hypothetical protein
MRPNDIFSIKDFFNYYFAGFLWILDFLVISLLLSTIMGWGINFSGITIFLDSLNVTITTIGFILLPYLTGFILNPISTIAMEKIRNRFNEAIHWVTDPKHKWAGQGLKEWERNAIQVKMQELFNVRDKKPDELFFTIRAYIEEHSQGASSLATRALDLTNLAESIVIPLPSFFLIIGTYYLVLKSFWAAFWFIIAAILIFALVLDRYLKLRSYWVKHVYRAFLATTAKKVKTD